MLYEKYKRSIKKVKLEFINSLYNNIFMIVFIISLV